jgi:hypothetical protein
MDRESTNTDNEKRGKLLLVAGVISLAVFLSKIFQGDTEFITWRIYMDGGIYFLVAFIGLLWAFNFQVKLKSFLYIFQASFFVFSEIIFVEFFFFQKFGRLYESLLLLALLIVMFAGNYVSFLMANVLNVDLFKKIPLAQVGRTSSYLISLLMIYFFSFAFLSSDFPLYILLPLVLVIYFIITLIHYVNIDMEGEELIRKAFLTALIPFILFLGLFLSGNMHEVTSAVPALGYYLGVSMVTQEQLLRKTAINFTFSMSLLLIIFAISIILNIVAM